MLKPIYWVGSSKDDLLEFPEEVRAEVGFSLYIAQKGEKHHSVKPLKGFKGALASLRLLMITIQTPIELFIHLDLKTPYMFSTLFKKNQNMEYQHLKKKLT